MNPNNCTVCEHKTNNPDGGHCYMFREAPQEVCAQHSARTSWDWLPSMPSMPGPGLTLDVVNVGLNLMQIVQANTAQAAAAAVEGVSTVGSAVGTGLSAAAEGTAAGLDAVLSAGGAIAEGLGDVLGSIDF